MNKYGLKRHHRCHSKVIPIISMDGINRRKTPCDAISVPKENNPRLICVSGKDLSVAETTDMPSLGVF